MSQVPIPRRHGRVSLWVLTIALFGAVPSAHAQRVDFALYAGPNASRLTPSTVDPSGDYSTLRGSVVGLALRMQVLPSLSVRAEFQVSEKGARRGDVFRIDFRYLEFPLLLEYAPFPAARLRPVALLGLAASREVACTGLTQDPYFLTPPPPRTLDCNEYRNVRSDVAWTAGVGGSVALASVDLLVELRHVRGWRDLTGFGNTHRSTALLVGVRMR